MRSVRAVWSALAVTGLALAMLAPTGAPATASTMTSVRAVAVPGSSDAERAAVNAYVTAVYNDLFDRDPDPIGLAGWGTKLLAGTSYGEVANGITYSDEYRSRLITAAYRQYLGRDPDPAGLAGWLGAMQRGVQIEDIQAWFISSEEFYARYGATATGLVTGLYLTVLGREASAGEIQAWVSQLARGVARRDVARGFLFSSEHLASVVDGYYVDLLGRHLDPVGRAGWVGLIQGGHRDEEIIAGIVASDEYRSKAQEPASILVGPSGIPSNISGRSISADGRWVAFDTTAPAVPGDSGDDRDVFVWDRTTRTTTLVSTGVDGSPANGDSWQPSISADGRWVAFASNASNLVSGDTNAHSDVFVWDRTTGQISALAPQVDTGQNGFFYDPAISADGRWVAYALTASNWGEIFVTDRLDGTTTLVSAGVDGWPANAHSSNPAISADGRWITYQSGASNLATDDGDGNEDVFLWDRETGETSLVSASTGVHDVYFAASISADGHWVAYTAGISGDPFSNRDVLVWDRVTDTTWPLPAPDTGAPGEPMAQGPSISTDGRWVVFSTSFDVFVMDRATGIASPVPIGPLGQQGNDFSQSAVISADGRWVVYESAASNLVDGDTNGTADVFVSRNPRGPR